MIDDSARMQICFQLGDSAFAARNNQKIEIRAQSLGDIHINREIMPPMILLPPIHNAVFGRDRLKYSLRSRQSALNLSHLVFVKAISGENSDRFTGERCGHAVQSPWVI